ncbi:MAG: zinc ribbon domain-containing protein [Clostridiales bacterium]|nr:zinc ribbon domain-containing protein [Clostridiales bacterium]
MNCVKCGKAVAEGNRFCMFCGTPVGTQAQPSAHPGGPAPAPVTQQTPVAAPAAIPYAPPSVQGGNIIIPAGRKYRIVCPDCHWLCEDIKRDATPGFPCSSCGKAYAYGGQLLLYRMGNGMPSCAMLHVDIVIDGVVYGEIKNTEAVRIMLSNGTHIIGMTSRPAWPYSPNQSNQFQIVIGPQSNNLAFKLSIVYRYMASNGLELRQCDPREIPGI